MMDKRQGGNQAGRAAKELDSRDSPLNAHSSYTEYFKYAHIDFVIFYVDLFYGLVGIDFM